MLLGAHPELVSVGELKASRLGDPERYLCSCRRRIAECEFWNNISRRMAGMGEDFSILDAKTDLLCEANAFERRLLAPLVRGPALELARDMALQTTGRWGRVLQRFQDRNEKLMKAVLEESGAKTIVDSSKIGIRLKYLLKNPNLDIKVVWLVRDGRGVTLAYYNPSEFADSKDESLRGGGVGKTFDDARDIETGAHEWKRCNEEAIAVLEGVHEDNWLKVHYEDICNKTEDTLDEVLRFIGADPGGKVLDFRSVNHHMVGNGMRLDSTSEISLDERWKERFDADQLARFDQVAGDLNRRLGYS